MKPLNALSTRRQFVRLAARWIAGIPFISAGARAWSADLPILAEDDPVAKALGYARDAAKVDTSKYPKRAGAAGATQLCSNCLQYAAIGDGTGTCTIFAGKRVAAGGWCSVWVMKK